MFNKGEKRNVYCTNLFEKVVDIKRVSYIFRINNTKYLWNYTMLHQQLKSSYNLLPRLTAIFSTAVDVMKLSRTINAYSDNEFFADKKSAPFFIDKHSIGLDSINNLPAGRFVSFLKMNNFHV